MVNKRKKRWPLILLIASLALCISFALCFAGLTMQQAERLPTPAPPPALADAVVPTPTQAPTDVPTSPPSIPTDTPPPTSPAPSLTSVPTNPPPPTATPVPGDALATVARQQLGNKLMAAEQSEGVAGIDYDQGAQWNEYSAVESAVYNLIMLAPNVFSLEDVEMLKLSAYGDFTDTLGNSKKAIAVQFTISRALAEKINWKGINMHRIGQALKTDEASRTYVHPALQKAWIEFSSE